jgi:hypothetical protein
LVTPGGGGCEELAAGWIPITDPKDEGRSALLLGGGIGGMGCIGGPGWL